MAWVYILIYFITTSLFWAHCQYGRIKKEMPEVKWWYCLCVGLMFGWVFTPLYCVLSLMIMFDKFINKMFDIAIQKFCSDK